MSKEKGHFTSWTQAWVMQSTERERERKPKMEREQRKLALMIVSFP